MLLFPFTFLSAEIHKTTIKENKLLICAANNYDPTVTPIKVINIQGQDICYKKYSYLFYKNEHRGTLAKDQMYNNILYKGNRTFTVHSSGQVGLAFPAQKTKIDGYWFKEDKAIGFHKNGNIASGTLACKTRTKDGFYLQEDSTVHFHKNGRFEMGTLAQGKRIRGRFYKDGTFIRLSESGRVMSNRHPDDPDNDHDEIP